MVKATGKSIFRRQRLSVIYLTNKNGRREGTKRIDGGNGQAKATIGVWMH
jgi:hypothetical protein